MSTSIKSSRRDAFLRQGGKCFYCSVRMWLTTPQELGLAGELHSSGYRRLRCTAEHLRARCDGGSNESANVVAACAHCNGTRHKRKQPPEPHVYRRDVQKRVRRGSWHHPDVFALGLLPTSASASRQCCTRPNSLSRQKTTMT